MDRNWKSKKGSSTSQNLRSLQDSCASAKHLDFSAIYHAISANNERRLTQGVTCGLVELSLVEAKAVHLHLNGVLYGGSIGKVIVVHYSSSTMGMLCCIHTSKLFSKQTSTRTWV